MSFAECQQQEVSYDARVRIEWSGSERPPSASSPDDPAQYGGPNEAGTEWVKKKPPPHIAADMMKAMTWKAKQKEIKKEWEQKHLGGGLEKTISQKLRESKGS